MGQRSFTAGSFTAGSFTAGSFTAAAARRIGSVAGASVLALAALAATAAAPAAHRAYDPVTGTFVTVTRPMDTTPVHPEPLTHPRDDDMGTVTSASTVTSGNLVQQALSGVRNATASRLPGIDVSSHQKRIDWSAVAGHIDFSYAKATEGTYYANPYFHGQDTGASGAGLFHGAYHFAIPSNSGGAAQADFFVARGGGWSAAGKTLPGTLDIEYNPYGSECYGLSQSQMTTWVSDFVDEYAFDTGTFPVIYTTAGWWSACTGDASGFGVTDPLWVASYSSSPGTLPGGHLSYTFWQYADAGPVPGDQDYYNGGSAGLSLLAGAGV